MQDPDAIHLDELTKAAAVDASWLRRHKKVTEATAYIGAASMQYRAIGAAAHQYDSADNGN